MEGVGGGAGAGVPVHMIIFLEGLLGISWSASRALWRVKALYGVFHMIMIN